MAYHDIESWQSKIKLQDEGKKERKKKHKKTKENVDASTPIPIHHILSNIYISIPRILRNANKPNPVNLQSRPKQIKITPY